MGRRPREKHKAVAFRAPPQGRSLHHGLSPGLGVLEAQDADIGYEVVADVLFKILVLLEKHALAVDHPFSVRVPEPAVKKPLLLAEPTEDARHYDGTDTTEDGVAPLGALEGLAGFGGLPLLLVGLVIDDGVPPPLGGDEPRQLLKVTRPKKRFRVEHHVGCFVWCGWFRKRLSHQVYIQSSIRVFAQKSWGGFSFLH